MLIDTDELKLQIEKHFDKEIKDQQEVKPDKNNDISEEQFKHLNSIMIWQLSKTKIEKHKVIELVERLAKQFLE